MTQQYWLGDFYIDLSRNQITGKAEPQILAPKALAVLTYLAQHQGKVISQEQLLDNVWPTLVVSPNTLQRSIAQLRKALGDNGKIQQYIKTHAKQGYSLECSVTWCEPRAVTAEATAQKIIETAVDETIDNVQESNLDVKTAPTITVRPEAKFDDTKQPMFKRPLLATSIFIGILLIGLFGILQLTHPPTSRFEITEIREITATDNSEMASLYSPDGRYILFHRYLLDSCVNHIWAKDIETQTEFQLTRTADNYGAHSFSPDGKKLAFIRDMSCQAPITQKTCHQLVALDFASALQSPQDLEVLLQCEHSEIKKPRWLNNGNISLLQKQASRWQLLSYSTTDNSSEILHAITDGSILHYDYSVADDLIALISIHSDNQYYVEVLQSDGKLVSSHPIDYPDHMSHRRWPRANFSAIEQQLFFSTGRRLFNLSFDGKISDLNLTLDQPIWSAVFHPGGNKALAIKGVYDSDIAAISLSETTDSKLKTPNVEITARSIVSDGQAQAQPQGDLVAFASARTGATQVWLTDGQTARQLSDFAVDTQIYGLAWSSDGTRLLVNADNRLVQLFISDASAAAQQAIKIPYSVIELLAWDSNNNRALLFVRINGVLKLAELNTANLVLTTVTDSSVKWAVKGTDNQVIYTDQMDRFWRSGPVEPKHIKLLDGKLGERQRFITKDNWLYGVDQQFQLWRYHLSEATFEVIATLPSNVDYISDIDEHQLLVTLRVSAKKEVVEVSLGKR